MKQASTRAEIADLIARSSATGCGHLAHLLRPVMAGQLNLIMPLRDTAIPPLYRMGKMGRPLVVLVGDDDYAKAGPAGWACAEKLRRWASFAIVHGAGAEDEHYAAAAVAAALHRRLLFIETTSVAAQLWAGFLRVRADLPFTGILPNDGLHPVAPERLQ